MSGRMQCPLGLVFLSMAACRPSVALDPSEHHLSVSGQRSLSTSRESTIKAISWASDRLDLFARDAHGGLMTKSWTNGGWAPSGDTWTPLGGPIEGGPEAVTWGSGRLDVFARFADGNLYTKYLADSTWVPSATQWTSLGAPSGATVVGHPSAASWGPQHLHVLVAASDGHAYLKALVDGTSWFPSQTGWTDMGGTVVGSPKLVSRGSDWLDLLIRQPDGNLYLKSWTSAGWNPSETGWTSLGAPDGVAIAGNPTAVSWGPGLVHILVSGTDGNAYLKAWDGSAWVPSQTGWVNLGPAVGTPEVVSWGSGRLDFFTRRPDGSIGIKSFVGDGWVPSVTGWNSLGMPTRGYFNSPISAVSWASNHLHIFTVSSDQRVQAKAWDGSSWFPSDLGWGDLGGPVAADSLTMTPFWSGSVMADETVLMVASDSSHLPEAQLLWPASKILSVRDASGETEYLKGIDWEYDAATNTLRLLPGSQAISMNQSDLYPTSSAGGNVQNRLGGGYVLFSEGSFFHDRQLLVSYVHGTGLWNGFKPTLASSQLPRTLNLLATKSPLKIALLGDSISAGYNASGFSATSAQPFQPSWGELVARQLSSHYGAAVTLSNFSVAGTTSAWGTTQTSAVAASSPDLVIVAFGMNDGSTLVTSTAFKRNIAKILSSLRAALPQVEFILVAPMLPNPEVADYVGTQRVYAPVLRSLAKAGVAKDHSGVAFADMTSTHDQLLSRKKYRDMTGNNVNHPNDFLVRWYAQMVAGLLVPPQ